MAYHPPLPIPLSKDTKIMNKDTCFQFVFDNTCEYCRSTPRYLKTNQPTNTAAEEIVDATTVL